MKRAKATKQGILVAASCVGGALLLTLSGLYFYGKVSEERIVPGLHVGAVGLANQTLPDAIATLQAASDNLKTISIVVDGKSHNVTVADYGIVLDSEKTAKRAFALGVRPQPFAAGWLRATHLLSPAQILATVTVDDEKLENTSADFADKVGVGLVDAQIQYKKGVWSVVPSKLGRGVRRQVIADSLTDAIRHLRGAPIVLASAELDSKISTSDAEALLPQAKLLAQAPIKLIIGDQTFSIEPSQLASWVRLVPGDTVSGSPTITLDRPKVTNYIKSIAKDFDQDPQDAQVSFTDGQLQVAQINRDGRSLDQKVAVEAIIAAFPDVAQRELVLPVTTRKSEVTSSSLTDLGIKELIGKATTSYVGSPANRKHNITNGVKFMTGKLIKPGSEFSAVTALGAVDDTTGYLPELVIKDNKTQPEFGGGLCQVSTTLFRAAMNAGLKITARTNHSYRVPYYERGVGPGLDATIYLPKPDFKFLNDTPGWVLIQGYVTPKKNEVTFELYGTSDGRRGEVGKPLVYGVQAPPPAIYAQSDTVAAGKTKQVDHAHPGAKTSVVYKVFKSDGSLLFTQTFNSVYKPWAARYLVGTGVIIPTNSPSPSPTVTTSSPSVSPTTETPIPTETPSATPTATETSTPTPTPTVVPTETETTPAP